VAVLTEFWCLTAFRKNIISVSKLCDRGFDILCTKDSVKMLRSDNNMAVAVGPRVGGLYRIPLDDVFAREESVFNISSTHPDVDSLTLFHQRTGDTALDILREAVRTQLVEGVSLPRSCVEQRLYSIECCQTPELCQNCHSALHLELKENNQALP
jgi:hypothetical protein